MNKLSQILSISLLTLSVSSSGFAAEDCPPNADPAYCKIAKETGGKVFDGHSAKDWEGISKEKPYLTAAKPVHKYSAFSKDIGCSEWTDKRSHEICQSLSDNLEWGWTGHAMIAPGWKSTWATAKNTYCEQKVSMADLPILTKMCGNEIKEYMSCIQPMDSRFAVGVGNLINILRSQKEVTPEFKGSIFDPQNNNYLLKGGCK